MKRKAITVVLLSLSTMFGSTTVALADTSSDYKAQKQAHSAAKGAAHAAKKAIAEKFRSDVAASRVKTKAAIDAATTAEAKNAARAVGKAEIDALIAARSAAIAAIPNPGVAPVKPIKTPRPVKTRVPSAQPTVAPAQ
jgi:hypothetical protein